MTHLSRAILPTDEHGVEQVVGYFGGVGGSSTTFLDHIVAGGTGAGLSENIREAYGFLVNNYVVGDSIFINGFSRGAYTARSVGGMIGAIGLLTKAGQANFYQIFQDYENAGMKGYKPKLPTAIPDFNLGSVKVQDVSAYLSKYNEQLEKLGLTRKVTITAIGVWDTVGSLGIPVHPWLQRILGRTAFQEYQFYDTKLGNHVLNAFQALALDELRAAFVPTLWELPEGCTTKMKQCWFAGAHSNAGGGADEADNVR